MDVTWLLGGDMPLYWLLFIIIIIIIIIAVVLLRRRKASAHSKEEHMGFIKPPDGGPMADVVWTEHPPGIRISANKERRILRSMKDLEKAMNENLITQDLYEKARKKLLEE